MIPPYAGRTWAFGSPAWTEFGIRADSILAQPETGAQGADGTAAQPQLGTTKISQVVTGAMITMEKPQ